MVSDLRMDLLLLSEGYMGICALEAGYQDHGYQDHHQYQDWTSTQEAVERTFGGSSSINT